MRDDKNFLENLADAAVAKVNEGADRARAAGHDVASGSGNLLDNVSDKLKEGADRTRAEVHNAEAHSAFDKAKEQLGDAIDGLRGK